MIRFDLLQRARDALGDVIGNFDDHQQGNEALRLRASFEKAIDQGHPQRGEILALLGRNPIAARDLVDELLRKAA